MQASLDLDLSALVAADIWNKIADVSSEIAWVVCAFNDPLAPVRVEIEASGSGGLAETLAALRDDGVQFAGLRVTAIDKRGMRTRCVSVCVCVWAWPVLFLFVIALATCLGRRHDLASRPRPSPWPSRCMTHRCVLAESAAEAGVCAHAGSPWRWGLPPDAFAALSPNRLAGAPRMPFPSMLFRVI